MATDPETLYRQLGRLIQSMPDLDQDPVTEEMYEWTARAYALVRVVAGKTDVIKFRLAMDDLGGSTNSAHHIRAVVYRAFGIAERRAPPGVAGAFVPAGDGFDAYAAVSKVLETATQDVLIVDPYMDQAVLTVFAPAVPERVNIRLMADEKSHKPTLEPAAAKWVEQYGDARPLSLRLAPPRSLHDRAIFIDHRVAWTLTQSLKDFAARAHAEIIRADDTAELKIDAYEGIWASAQEII